MSANFDSVPVVDYALLSQGKQDEFVQQLRQAAINVGFLYLAHPPIDKDIFDSLLAYIPKLFEIPQEKKDAIAMENSQHFLGYSRLGKELTKGATDQREQFDFATQHQCKWKPGDPEFVRLWGEAQWPEESAIPGFKDTMQRYLSQVQALSIEFTRLLSSAFGLSPTGLDRFYDLPQNMQHRAKIVKYPSLDDASLTTTQGVGPHFDAGFLTFLLQASPHPGLQVQNLSGQWIDAPPIPDTFVINIGKGLEAATRGLAKATSHRVLSPPKGSTPRYSVPFFQNIAQRIRVTEHVLKFPQEVLALKEKRGTEGAIDSVNFSEYDRGEASGQANLIGRVKSHPDVAQRHYPELFKQIFPQGLPAQGLAY